MENEEEEVEKVWDKGKGIRRRKRWRKCGTQEREQGEGRDGESVRQRKEKKQKEEIEKVWDKGKG
jgi:hypothetical protein